MKAPKTKSVKGGAAVRARRLVRRIVPLLVAWKSEAAWIVSAASKHPPKSVTRTNGLRQAADLTERIVDLMKICGIKKLPEPPVSPNAPGSPTGRQTT